jgi:hypothetical protein
MSRRATPPVFDRAMRLWPESFPRALAGRVARCTKVPVDPLHRSLHRILPIDRTEVPVSFVGVPHEFCLHSLLPERSVEEVHAQVLVGAAVIS